MRQVRPRIRLLRSRGKPRDSSGDESLAMTRGGGGPACKAAGAGPALASLGRGKQGHPALTRFGRGKQGHPALATLGRGKGPAQGDCVRFGDLTPQIAAGTAPHYASLRQGQEDLPRR